MVSLKRRIGIDTVYQLLTRFLTVGITLFTSALITRLSGLHTYGEYAIVVTYVTAFFVLADFGMNAIVVRDFAKDEAFAKSHYGKLLLFRSVWGTMLMLLAGCVLLFMPYSLPVKTAIVWVLPGLLFLSITKASATLFQAFSKFNLLFWSTALGGICSLLIILVGSQDGTLTLSEAVLSLLVMSIVTSALGVLFSRKFLDTSTSWIDRIYWKHVLIDSIPLGIGFLFNTAMVQADRWLLTVLSTSESVGTYFLAYRVFEFIIVLPTFLMTALYPFLIRAKESDQKRFQHLFRQALLFLSIGALILTLGVFVTAPFIIPAVWGLELTPAVLPLLILAAGTILFFTSSPLNWLVVIEKKEKYLARIYGVGMVLNVLLNILFIPKYDYIASAVITGLTELFIVFSLILVLRKK